MTDVELPHPADRGSRGSLRPLTVGPCEEELSHRTTIPPAAAARLDEVAALTAGPTPGWPALRAIYEAGEDLRVPPTVLSFPGGKPIKVSV